MSSLDRLQGPVEPVARAPRPIDPRVTIGHVHLRTADIDRVRDFYVGILGFDVVQISFDDKGAANVYLSWTGNRGQQRDTARFGTLLLP